MKLKQILVPGIFCLSLWPLQGLAAVTNEQFNSIKQLGTLNATALNCGFMDETRRMKQALVKALPKRRQLGDAFEAFTHEAFLVELEKKKACPDIKTFSKDVETAIDALNWAFIKK